jgi:hypothetical protein
VQHFVNHIQLMGLRPPAEAATADPDRKTGELPIVQTASRSGDQPGARPAQPSVERPRSSDAGPAPSAPKSRAGDSEVEKAVEEIKASIDAVAKSPH